MWYVLALIGNKEITVCKTEYKDVATITATSFSEKVPCVMRFMPDNWYKDSEKMLFAVSANTAIA